MDLTRALVSQLNNIDIAVEKLRRALVEQNLLCPRCRGTGEVIESRPRGAAHGTVCSCPCPECGGRGHDNDDPRCERCDAAADDWSVVEGLCQDCFEFMVDDAHDYMKEQGWG